MSNSKMADGMEKWQLIVIYMKKTTGVLEPYIKSSLTTWLEKNLQNSSKINFKDFIKKLNTREDFVNYNRKSRNRRRGTWEIVGRDPSDKLILDKILSLHSNPCYSNIQFKSNSWGECGDIAQYWMLAKIFMPHGNSNSRTPSDSDPLSIFDLLRNCRCFTCDFDRKCLDELCTARYLIKTKTSLTLVQMTNIVDSMQTLLQAPCLQEDYRVSRLIDELKGLLEESTIYITSMDLDSFKNKSIEIYCNDEKTTVKLEEGVYQLHKWLLRSGMEKLRVEIENEEREMYETGARKINYVRLGGVAGAGAIGTAATAVSGSIALALGGPVIVSAVAVGLVHGFFSIVGAIAGRAGGRVIAESDRIVDSRH